MWPHCVLTTVEACIISHALRQTEKAAADVQLHHRSAGAPPTSSLPSVLKSARSEKIKESLGGALPSLSKPPESGTSVAESTEPRITFQPQLLSTKDDALED